MFEAAKTAIDNGPIYPNVTQEEVRDHLRSRYDFAEPVPLESVVDDVEEMLRRWQTQVTHPRYFGLFNPSVTLASVVADTLSPPIIRSLQAGERPRLRMKLSATRFNG